MVRMDYALRAGVIAGALAAAGGAQGQAGEAFELSAAHAAYRDDNVLRRPEGSAADTYRVSSLGLKLEAPIGRQRLLGSLAVNSVRYDRFERFDLDGHEARALWQWRAGARAQGRLEATQRRALASLASVQDGVQAGVPNALTTRQALAAGEFRLAPGRQLELEGLRRDLDNAAEERRVNDLALERASAGLYYVSRAGNRLGLRAREARGTLPNAQSIGGGAVDNSSRQRELALAGDWRPGGHTRLHGHLGRVRRAYDELPQRDFEAGSGELALDWTPTGRLEFTAVAQRGISETEEIQLSFVFAERAALGTKYLLGARTELSLLLETSKRRYLGEAGQVLGTVAPRTERVNAVGFLAAYRPLERLTLHAGLRRETRSSDVAGAGYAVGVASLGARLAF
jgi:hypothetical protein